MGLDIAIISLSSEANFLTQIASSEALLAATLLHYAFLLRAVPTDTIIRAKMNPPIDFLACQFVLPCD